jgi:hypothetical protein
MRGALQLSERCLSVLTFPPLGQLVTPVTKFLSGSQRAMTSVLLFIDCSKCRNRPVVKVRQDGEWSRHVIQVSGGHGVVAPPCFPPAWRSFPRSRLPDRADSARWAGRILVAGGLRWCTVDVLQTDLAVRDQAIRLVGDVGSPELMGASLVEGHRLDLDPAGRE